MFRFQKIIGLTIAIAAVCFARDAAAFSLLGPPDGTQTERIGFMLEAPIGSDVGAPRNLSEEYRFNIRVLTYGFDPTFRTWFGVRGMQEVRKAMAVFNNLPPMSKLSRDLREFSTDTRRVNFRASALGLMDLKSWTVATMVEQLGLASAERFTWCLFARIPPDPIGYNVIKRNFDPVTLDHSSYVNDVLYTYFIPGTDPLPGLPRDVIDAIELSVDPQAFQFTSVSSAMGTWAYQPGGVLLFGEFLTGLTRDDVGGLRYIYSGKGRYANHNMEVLVGDAITNGVGGAGTPWTPVTGSNVVVSAALRPGIDRLIFREAQYDSGLGPFTIRTNNYRDTYILGNRRQTQSFQRILAQPDIIFGAAPLGATLLSRSSTNAAINNSGLGGNVIVGGPGILQPPIFIIYNSEGPLHVNIQTDSLDEQTSSINFEWGSFDGTTNAPFVYPNGRSIRQVEQRVLRR